MWDFHVLVSKLFLPLKVHVSQETLCRATVHSLVVGVPDSKYTIFRTYEGARWDYYTAKNKGRVKAVREPGDEKIFGPLSRAAQKLISEDADNSTT